MRKAEYLRSAAIMGALVFLSASGFAADRPYRTSQEPYPVSNPQPEETDVWAGGWYLRGDAGISVPFEPTLKTDTPISAIKYEDVKTDVSGFGGLGFGYAFSNGIRVDLTADYTLPYQITGFGSRASSTSSSVPTVFETKIQSATVMANGYYDIGTWSNITPYLGAGVGVSWTRVTDSFLDPDIAIELAKVQGLTVHMDGANNRQADYDSYNFAWALMAGAAIRLSDHFDVDVGYRYLNTGTTRSGGTMATDPRATLTGGVANPDQGQTKSLNNYTRILDSGEHQMRIGIRYKFTP